MSTPGSPRTPAYEAAPLFAEDVLEDGLLSFPIAALPSLPQPNRHALSSEVARGIGLIGWCVAATVGSAHGLAWLVENEPATFWSPVLFSTHVQAVAALVAHANLLLREPGFVQRSRESCLPVPPVVAERLRAGDTLSGLANVRNESDGASYCVRCCVWRPDPPPPADRAPTLFTQWLWKDLPSVARRCPCSGARPAHHCAVCQRCVMDHDHHCAVLGRCIAGRNMPWFLTLIFLSQTATLTILAAGLFTIYQLYGPSGGLYAGCALALWLVVSRWCCRPAIVLLRWLVAPFRTDAPPLDLRDKAASTHDSESEPSLSKACEGAR